MQALLLSLPRILRTTQATIPADIPYLHVPTEMVGKWRDVLQGCRGFRVGICWQGNTARKKDDARSVRLAAFAPIANVLGVQLVSLQVGPGAAQLHDSAVQFPVVNLASGFNPSSLLDAAAAILSLDLVITVDTAIAHLAGGLGVPVWIALEHVPAWRWLLDREDSPWYPTARLFRQKNRGDWDAVFVRMAQELGKMGAR